MKRKLMVLVANVILLSAMGIAVNAQDEIVEKRIKVTKNKQVIIKDSVYDGTEYDYTFKVNAAKTISVKIISKFADFKLAIADDIEVYPFTNWIKTYNGKISTELDYKDVIIKVRSNYKSSDFKLIFIVK
ncbi:MAG: hypothetical protein ACK5NT_14540 [Pyrinomonadaceae bacterium]